MSETQSGDPSRVVPLAKEKLLQQPYASEDSKGVALLILLKDDFRSKACEKRSRSTRTAYKVGWHFLLRQPFENISRVGVTPYCDITFIFYRPMSVVGACSQKVPEIGAMMPYWGYLMQYFLQYLQQSNITEVQMEQKTMLHHAGIGHKRIRLFWGVYRLTGLGWGRGRI